MCFLFFVCVCFLKRERKNIKTKLGESEGGEDLGRHWRRGNTIKTYGMKMSNAGLGDMSGMFAFPSKPADRLATLLSMEVGRAAQLVLWHVGAME